MLEHLCDGWMCTDCLMLVANGETPHDWTEEETAEWLARIDAREEPNTHTFPGDDEQEFSWAQCDMCGSRLGGARFSFSTFKVDV